jgi:hypothetical protein
MDANFLVYGQSLARLFFDETATNASNSNVGVWNGTSFAAITGSNNPGPYGFGNHYQATHNISLGFLNRGHDGTGITSLKGGSTNMTNCLSAVNASGNTLHGIIWIHGETDAAGAMTQATYEGHLLGASDSVIDTIRANVTNGSSKSAIPVLIVLLGRTSETTDANLMRIRDALYNVATTGTECYLAAQHVDLPHNDGWHLSAAGYETLGRRLAQTALYIAGQSSYHRGPYIENAVEVDSTHVDVNLVHRGGSDISPTSGINGFEVKDNGAWASPSAAVRQDANTVRLTVSTLTALQDVRAFYGIDGGDSGGTFGNTFSDPLVDNTTLALPVEYTSTTPIVTLSAIPVKRNHMMQQGMG